MKIVNVFMYLCLAMPLIGISTAQAEDSLRKTCNLSKGLLQGRTCFCPADSPAGKEKKLTCSGGNLCDKELVSTLCNTKGKNNKNLSTGVKKVSVLSGDYNSEHHYFSSKVKSKNFRYVASNGSIGTCEAGDKLSPGQSCLCGAGFRFKGKKLTCAGEAVCNEEVVNNVCGTHHSERDIKNQGFYVLHRTNSGKVKYRTKYAPIRSTKTIEKTKRQIATESLGKEFSEEDSTDWSTGEFDESANTNTEFEDDSLFEPTQEETTLGTTTNEEESTRGISSVEEDADFKLSNIVDSEDEIPDYSLDEDEDW